MTVSDVERLVAELLNTGEMNADTVADLERILAEARDDRSYPDDLDYLAALHARILSPDRVVDAVEDDAPRSADVEAELREEISRLQAELADARQTIAELESRLATGV